jgi:TM2 domain-containing membrane protein YozV
MNFEDKRILTIFSARNIVFTAMLAVGTLCIFMSARNTASYLVLTGMDRMISTMTGIALIVFSSTSFTAAQLFLAQKGAAKLFSLLFVAVGITVITFSIFSTLSLNYSKFIVSEAIQADIVDKIERRRSEIIAEYQELETDSRGQDVNQWVMQNMDRLLSMAERSGESWNNSMRTVMETAQGLNEKEQQKNQTLDEILENIYVETIPRTFFGFMLDLQNLEKKYFFDFFMIAIPAVFYDLIAPLAMTVVLFLMGFKMKAAPEKPGIHRTREQAPYREKRQPPDLKELTIYIESALQDDFSLLPDDVIGNIEEKQCRKFREYLMNFIYKGNPIITGKSGRYISVFDKQNLKRFVELYYNVQRSGDGRTL